MPTHHPSPQITTANALLSTTETIYIPSSTTRRISLSSCNLVLYLILYLILYSIMEPPMEQVFETRDKLITSIQQHALSHGYAITTITSNSGRNITLGCDRGGIYRDRVQAPDGAKRRKTSTKRIGCPFRLYGKKLANNQWQIQVRNPTHNHESDDRMIEHSLARRRQLTEDQNNTIKHLLDSGSKPHQIISLLRAEQPDILIKPKDCHNIRKELRREKLGNYTPLEFPRETLQNDNWRYEFKQDSESNKTSDQRVIKKKAPSKCSNCGEIGHTIRSCRV